MGAAVLALVGCAASTVRNEACSDDAGAALTPECFSERYVEATCAVFGRLPIQYYGILALHFSDPAACRATLRADAEAYAAELGPTGALVFDAVAATQCLERIERGHHPSEEASAACMDVYSAPGALVGAPCVRGRCAVGARCRETPSCRSERCEALVEPGAACNAPLQCESAGDAVGFCVFSDTARCVQRVVEDVPLGGACSASFGEPGTVYRACGHLAQCVSGVCEPRSFAVGDDCSVSPWCAPGRYCAESRRCEAPTILPRGAACAAASEMSTTAFCDIVAGLVCDLRTRTCEPIGSGTEGERCGGGWSVATDTCRAGLACIGGRCVSAPACSG